MATVIDEEVVSRLKCKECKIVRQMQGESETALEQRAFDLGDYHWWMNLDGVNIIVVECDTHLFESMSH